MDDHYVTPEKACRMLKVSNRTLQIWSGEGKIEYTRTKGGHRRYLISSLVSKPTREGKRICYCRVSSQGQKEDLNRQKEFFRQKYPDHTIVSDIGSGLNFKRKGLNSILDSAIEGDISEVVVTHKDRLCRFAFEIIEKLINKGNGRIVVLNRTNTSPHEELTNDLISIVTCFSSRLYGLRSHKIRNAIKEAIEAQDDEVQVVSL